MNNREYVKQQPNNEFARPYINRQVYEKSYEPTMALKKGTFFPKLYLVESNHYNDLLYQNPQNITNKRSDNNLWNTIKTIF